LAGAMGISEWKQITREIGADLVVMDNEMFDSRKSKGDTIGLGKVLEDMFLSLLSYVTEEKNHP
jgi:hypothetical protein